MSAQTQPSSTTCRAPTIWPLDFRVSPVTEFVEIPIRGHERYTSIEIQRLHTTSGEGLAAIVHRVDQRVDVYFESLLCLDEVWRKTDPAMMHLLPGVLAEARFESRVLDIGVDAVECDVAFRDVDGELVRLVVRQPPGRGRRTRMFVPMPVGATASVLRLLMLDRFCMVRRRGTVISVQIGDSYAVPLGFPLPVGFARRYSGRFSAPVLLAGLNPAGSHPLGPLPGPRFDETGALVSTRVEGRGDWFELRFEPALPRPDAMLAGEPCRGALAVWSSVGEVTRCGWTMFRTTNGGTVLRFDEIEQNWFPSAVREPTLFGLVVLRWLKRRRGRLSWTGHLSNVDDAPVLQSAWSGGTLPAAGPLPSRDIA